MTADQITTMEGNGSEHFGVKGPTKKNLIKVWAFLSRKMRICTQICIHFQGILSIQEACLKKPAYEPLFQSKWMQGTIWALPYVAKKSLLAPNTEGQPLPYLAFCLPLELHRHQMVLANVLRESQMRWLFQGRH